MKSNLTITKAVPTLEEREFLEQRLYEHNRDQTGQDDGEMFGFFIRDEQTSHEAGDGDGGELIAGVTGWTWARCCEIEQLWVHPAWRGQGYGRKLLQAAEDHARARGVKVIAIDSYSFQAPEFYQKYGYELAWQMEEFPPGYHWCFLVKRFTKAGDGEDRGKTQK
jgi:GNAT superfamily N-acetyltransferase